MWTFGTSNQLFILGSETEETFFSKIKAVTGKTPFFVTDPSCTPHSVCPNIGI